MNKSVGKQHRTIQKPCTWYQPYITYTEIARRSHRHHTPATLAHRTKPHQTIIMHVYAAYGMIKSVGKHHRTIQKPCTWYQPYITYTMSRQQKTFEDMNNARAALDFDHSMI
jgi:hypothetical protein